MKYDGDQRRRLLLAVFAALGAVALLYMSVHSTQIGDEGTTGLISADNAKPATDWTLSSALSGKNVHLLSRTLGGPVVMDFWATYCGPCKAEMPEIAQVAKKYQGRVSVYGIDASDSPDMIRAFQTSEKLPYDLLVDDNGVVSNGYDIQTIPEVVVVDKNGNIRAAYDGYDPTVSLTGRLSNVLDALLSEQQSG